MFIWNNKHVIISMVININMFRIRNWCDFPSWQPPYMTITQPKRWQWGLNHKNSRREKFGHSTQVFIHLARLRSFIEYNYWIYLDCHYLYMWIHLKWIGWFWLVFFGEPPEIAGPVHGQAERSGFREGGSDLHRGAESAVDVLFLAGWFIKKKGSPQQGDDHKSYTTLWCLIKRTILVRRPKFWMPWNLSQSLNIHLWTSLRARPSKTASQRVP